jgi:hypothetical protein
MRAAWQPSHQRKQLVQVLRGGGRRRPGGALPVPVPPALKGHPGATMLSAFPALAPRRHGAYTVLTGLLDR